MLYYTNEVLRKMYEVYCYKNNISVADGIKQNNIIDFYNFVKEADKKLNCSQKEFIDNLLFAYGAIEERFSYYRNLKTVNYTIHKIINDELHQTFKLVDSGVCTKKVLCDYAKVLIDKYVLVDNAEKEIIYQDIRDVIIFSL